MLVFGLCGAIMISEEVTARHRWSPSSHAAPFRRPAWGNYDANLHFLQSTGLLQDYPLRILEIGSGQGLLLQELSKRGHHVVGIDLDEKIVNDCEYDIPLSVALADDLPFANKSFDVVVSFDVFEHIPNSDKHLSEVRRVLVVGGHYMLSTPNKLTSVPFEMLRYANERGLQHTFDFLKPPDHCSLHTYWKLRERLIENGFDVVFHDVSVVNQYFVTKVQYVAGRLGLAIISVCNPDRLPLPWRTNFYVDARARD